MPKGLWNCAFGQAIIKPYLQGGVLVTSCHLVVCVYGGRHGPGKSWRRQPSNLFSTPFDFASQCRVPAVVKIAPTAEDNEAGTNDGPADIEYQT